MPGNEVAGRAAPEVAGRMREEAAQPGRPAHTQLTVCRCVSNGRDTHDQSVPAFRPSKNVKQQSQSGVPWGV